MALGVPADYVHHVCRQHYHGILFQKEKVGTYDRQTTCP